MSNFKVDLLKAAQAFVPNEPVILGDDDGGQYLVTLTDTVTAALVGTYSRVQINPIILDGQIRVIGDEDWDKKNDTFEVVYNIENDTAVFVSSGDVS